MRFVSKFEVLEALHIRSASVWLCWHMKIVLRFETSENYVFVQYEVDSFDQRSLWVGSLCIYLLINQLHMHVTKCQYCDEMRDYLKCVQSVVYIGLQMCRCDN